MCDSYCYLKIFITPGLAKLKIDLVEDIRNSWLYCFTNPLDYRHDDDAKAKQVSQIQEDL